MIEFPSKNWKDYELLDSGNGEKLERFGRYILIRPEPKALWTPSMSAGEWKRLAHVHFRPGAGFGKAGKEDSGTWDKFREMEDQWYIRYGGWNAVASGQARAKAEQAGWQTADARAKAVQAGPSFSLRLGLTSFKHVGVFPEQAPNWEFIYRKVQALKGSAGLGPEGRNTRGSIAGGPSRRDGGVSPKGELPPGQGPAALKAGLQAGLAAAAPKVLNLFAYTGGASLAAKAAGADVTHLDSVRQVVSWARGNMERSGLDGIRWVVEDAMKFASREAKRGHLYDGIILDPPAYGHGPDGEKWKLDECLFGMLREVSRILNPDRGFMVLNLYSNGYSAALGETLVREAFGIGAGTSTRIRTGEVAGSKESGKPAGQATIESGELALDDSFGKVLPLSIYVRLSRDM